MEYRALAEFFERLEGTSKRLEMTAILVEMLEAVPAPELEAVVRLLQGKVRPDWEGIELGLAEKMMLQTLARVAGLDAKRGGIDTATHIYHEAGDLGLAAERLLTGRGSAQVGLAAFGDAPAKLEVPAVYDQLLDIAKTGGAGSQESKQQKLWKLLTDASPLEARYIVRTVAGRLRLGVADLTFLDAMAAWQVGRGVRSVQEMEPAERAEQEETRARLERAYDVCSDLAILAATVTKGLDAVDKLGVTPGVPLRPMAAERSKTLADILTRHEGRSAVEVKYDGLRVQAHISAGGVQLFSRRMEDLTNQFPDVQASLAAACPTTCIVEGEIIAVDAETGALRPFQDVSRRRGRKTGLGEDARKETSLADGAATATTVMDEVPVAVFLFDCLAVEGTSIMTETYMDRRNRIQQLFTLGDAVRLSTMTICEDEASMEAAFLQAVEDGGEGIMCKALDGPYKAGNRGFAWIKYKTDYTEELVDSMDLAVIGAFYGRGRRAGWYGALLMAAWDPDTQRFASVCKLGTGFDDETLIGLKDKFASHVAPQKPDNVDAEMTPDVWLHPAIVMEVEAAEMTLSPIHRAGWSQLRPAAGIAARFPRFTGRWRDDKAPEQATTVSELVTMYQAQ